MLPLQLKRFTFDKINLVGVKKKQFISFKEELTVELGSRKVQAHYRLAR